MSRDVPQRQTISDAACGPVLPAHRFDEAQLARWLSGRLPGVGGGLRIRQFQGGQSNPTYLLEADQHAYVLRKQPSGKLVRGAHAVDREYRVQEALGKSNVPTPQMRLFCDDPSVIGQMFYVMDHVEGRIFTDRLLAGCTAAERAAVYDDMNAVLSSLHGLDLEALGLADFGRPHGYARRQVDRWGRQYRASPDDRLPAMDATIEWLEAHTPDHEAASLVHGDFRLGNLIYHPDEPRIVAVLDWELATIGHPLADLAYNCLSWWLPQSTGRGFSDIDYAALGIPGEADYLAAYARRRDLARIEDWAFWIVFAMFRSAAILGGVLARARAGTAADPRAPEIGSVYREIAARASQLTTATSS